MRNIIKKAAAIVCSIVAVASITSVGVSAFCSVGYGDYDVNITSSWFSGDSATAYITKCSCDEVNNNLMVWIRAQYKEGDSYVKLPVSGYYYDHQVNCNEAMKTIQHDNITFANARFYAKCGNSNINEDPTYIGEKNASN